MNGTGSGSKLGGNVTVRNSTGRSSDTVVEVDGVRIKGITGLTIKALPGEPVRLVLEVVPSAIDISTLDDNVTRVSVVRAA